LALAKPYKKTFVSAGILAVTLAILAPLRPFLIQVTIDDYILENDGPGLLTMIMILIGLLMVEAVFRYNFIYMTSWLGQSIIKNLRVRVLENIMRLNLKYFDKTAIGTSTTRTINDVETINDIFSQGLLTMIADLLTMITVMAVMFWMDWSLTLVTLATFPLLLVAGYIFKEKVKAAFQTVRNQISRLNAFLQEHITGMNIVQIFNAEKMEMEKFKEINMEHRKAHVRTVWYYSIFFPVVEIILATALGLMIWWGAQTSPGIIISFILLINMLFRPVRMLADKFNVIQMGMVASERVFGIFDLDQSISDTGTQKANTLRGDIEFKNVWFAYNEDEYVLKDISFKLEAGKTLAIIGATGSGKTSIINILNRSYEVNKGNILIDNVDTRDYELDGLLSNIGLVLQDVFLFSGSIIDNITLRNEAISREKVVEAAKIVGAHAFISKLPDGYDYDVMERGATLSMGQRQLISFIRALVFNPRILILDEATSSVDSESEELIQKATEKLVSNRTSIVIAHRLSTIMHADKILVLDHGEIQEEGTHGELLALNGAYKILYEMQFKKQVLV